MNICSIIGSCSNLSNTFYFQEKFIDSFVKKVYSNVDFVKLRDYNIEFIDFTVHKNFNYNIFGEGDIKIIQKKLLNADLIIFSSPVYMNNVSGVLKNFLDYFSLWTKIPLLAGKFCINLTTSSTVGGDYFVRNYLSDISAFLGLVSLGEFSIYTDLPFQLFNKNIENSIIENFVEKTMKTLKENISTNEKLERNFLNWKSFRLGEDIKHYLVENFDDIAYNTKIKDLLNLTLKLHDFDTFKDFVEYKRIKRL